MRRAPLIIFFWAVWAVAAAWPCDCRAPKPACAYLGADAIFLGRVSFTNDDGSGTFTQATLVRFDIQEAFKGIAPGTKQVWVDPGSFTSCYEEYRLGARYLIFAQCKSRIPADSAAMSVATGAANRTKPLPPGIDPARPPIIYWAPECSGSRPADGFPNIEMDYRMLRDYRQGKSLPRVFGRVYLAPFRGWPTLDGPILSGAQVVLTNGIATLRTTTLADGTFSLPDAPAGYYSISADLPPLVPVQASRMIAVPEVGCGSEDVALRTTSKLEGVVFDHEGRPAKGIPVAVEVVSSMQDKYPVTIDQETGAKGRFTIEGVPETDVRLYYGSQWPSSERVPYRVIYYQDPASPSSTGILRLRVGEQRTGMILRLPAPLKVIVLTVRVVRPDGRPVRGALVERKLQRHLHGIRENRPSRDR